MAKLRIKTGIFILILFVFMPAFFSKTQNSGAFETGQASFEVFNASGGHNLNLNPAFNSSITQYTLSLNGPCEIYFRPNLPEGCFFVAEGFRYYAGEYSHTIEINKNKIIPVRFGNDMGLGPAYYIQFILEGNNSGPGNGGGDSGSPPEEINEEINNGITDINDINDINDTINTEGLYLNSLEITSANGIAVFNPGFTRFNTRYTLNALKGDWLIIKMSPGKGVKAIIVGGKIYYTDGPLQLTTSNKDKVEISLIGQKGDSLTYTLLFENSLEAIPQNLPGLVYLRLNNGGIPLSPVFSSETNSYLAEIPLNTERITLNLKGEEGSYTTINNSPRDFLILDNLNELDEAKANFLIGVHKGGLVNYYFLRLLLPGFANNLPPEGTGLLSLKIIAGDKEIDALKYPYGENSFRIPLANLAKNIGISAVAPQGAVMLLGGKSFTGAGFWNYSLPAELSGDNPLYLTIISPDKGGIKTYSLLFYPQKTFIKVLVGSREIVINEAVKTMDAEAYEIKGRVMVPLRFISQALGAEINWHGEKKLVEIINQGRALNLYLNQSVPGMDVPPEIKNGRVFVPLRYIAQELKASVQWQPAEKLVLITK